MTGLTLALGALSGCTTRPERLRLPAEAGSLRGAAHRVSATTNPSDTHYVSGFRSRDDWLVHRVEAAGGLYRLEMRYRTDGVKNYVVRVNGRPSEGFFSPSPGLWRKHVHGVVELPRGESVVEIGGGWGFYDVAELTLTAVRRPAPPRSPPPAAANPKATPEARALLRWLCHHYGRTTFSGVYSEDDVTYVRDRTAHTPAVLGGDLMDYSPSRVERGADPRGLTERYLAAARRGHLITLSWHWNAPRGLLDRVDIDEQGREVNKRWYKGFNTNATTFDFAAALADPGGDDYRLLLRDIDAIAVELRKFADARVPLLWRPLHEAEGGWFWWGARGPEAYVRLWRLLYHRLTHVHGLHNLLWVYTAGLDPRWYPGDDVVDVVGADLYPQDTRDTTTWAWSTLRTLVGNRKLLALTEIGFVPDIDTQHRHGIFWSYYTTWTDQLGPRRHSDDELRSRFTESQRLRGLTAPGSSPTKPPWNTP